VNLYDRYFCYRCNTYPPDGAVLVSRPEPSPEAPLSTATVSEPVVMPSELAAVAVETFVKTGDTAPPPVSPPVETPSKAEEPEAQVEMETPPTKEEAPKPRPPLVRIKIFAAKKADLMDLCKAYDIDPSGTKEELRERLLSYLDELERETPEEEAVAEEERTTTESTEGPPISHEDTQASATSVVAIEFPPLEAKRPEPRPAPVAMSVVVPVIVERRPPPQFVVEPGPTPLIPTVAEPPTSTVEATTPRPAKAEHPCPTCGRELTYIAQYKRWYCYRCAAYAPALKSKFACPNCGAKLRWIPLYSRWWCDSCRRYAPADLPKPQASPTAETAPLAAEKPVAGVSSFATRTLVHHHQNPGSGIGLVGFGLIVYFVYAFFAYLGPMIGEPTPSSVSLDMLAVLQFFAFLFVALGAMMGLMALRHRD